MKILFSLTLLIFVSLWVSCQRPNPAVITDKTVFRPLQGVYSFYECQDEKGVFHEFWDSTKTFSVGDTIWEPLWEDSPVKVTYTPASK